MTCCSWPQRECTTASFILAKQLLGSNRTALRKAQFPHRPSKTETGVEGGGAVGHLSSSSRASSKLAPFSLSSRMVASCASRPELRGLISRARRKWYLRDTERLVGWLGGAAAEQHTHSALDNRSCF